MIDRRAILACGAAALAVRAVPAQPLLRVLFVGNSFLIDHDVPGQVAALAARAGRPIERHEILRRGARLTGHWRRATVRQTLSWGWEAVVLQDHSTEALYEDRARQSAAAIAAFAEAARPAAVILVSPWARAAGHPVYARAPEPGFTPPRTPAAMTAMTMAHQTRLAAATGARIAAVASAFEAATAAGRQVYAQDLYHANEAGAALAAEVIWAALAPVLG